MFMRDLTRLACADMPPSPSSLQIGRKQLVLAYYALLGQPVDTSLVRDIEAVSSGAC
jgi:hypothetical protein